MKLLTSAQMRELDRMTIEDVGVPGIVLMENASRGVFEVILRRRRSVAGEKCLVVCGKGNNGGDGFAVARHLWNAGADVRILVAAEPGEIAGDAATNRNVCEKLGIQMTVATDEKSLGSFFKNNPKYDFAVDALLGTGVRGAVRGHFGSVIGAVNSLGTEVYAVDLPSGMDADAGVAEGPVVRAAATVTFGAPKVGHFCYPGAEFCGSVYVVDIGIPRTVADSTEFAATLTEMEWVKAALPRRGRNAHKGSCGKLLIVGGSRGMAGAPALAAMAALKMGAGLVYVAAPVGIVSAIQRKLTEVVAVPLDETSDGTLAASALEKILEFSKKVDAVVFGPGVGVNEDKKFIAAGLLREIDKPLLVDADGLNCLAGTDVKIRKQAKVVFTPHPGEMARLAGLTIEEVNGKRFSTAKEFAGRSGATTILKGAGSVIAGADGTMFINPNGNAGMATAGSGDVLSGIAGCLLSEGMSGMDAAACGTFIHGLSGDIAAARRGERSVMASDIARYIPAAIASIMGKNLVADKKNKNAD